MRSIEDTQVLALLQAQRPPRSWAVYRVFLHSAHRFESAPCALRCEHCGQIEEPHVQNRPLRVVVLMKNGPLRRVSFLTDDTRDLDANARGWLNTLYNIAAAAGVPLDGWLAYDARG